MNQGDGGRVSSLAGEVAEASNFATYFGGSPASQSTPHLYISSLATWSRDSHLSRMWKKQFSHLPAFEQIGGEGSLPLLTIQDKQFYSVAFSSDGTRIVSASNNWSVQVWDASTGAEWGRFSGILDTFDLLHFQAMAPALSLVQRTSLCGYGMPQQVQSSNG